MYRDVSLMEGTIIHWRLEITWVLSILVKLCKNCKVACKRKEGTEPLRPAAPEAVAPVGKADPSRCAGCADVPAVAGGVGET